MNLALPYSLIYHDTEGLQGLGGEIFQLDFHGRMGFRVSLVSLGHRAGLIPGCSQSTIFGRGGHLEPPLKPIGLSAKTFSKRYSIKRKELMAGVVNTRRRRPKAAAPGSLGPWAGSAQAVADSPASHRRVGSITMAGTRAGSSHLDSQLGQGPRVRGRGLLAPRRLTADSALPRCVPLPLPWAWCPGSPPCTGSGATGRG